MASAPDITGRWADVSSPNEAEELFLSSRSTDLEWHGFSPFRRLDGSVVVWNEVWRPLFQAIPDLRRRPYIQLAGDFEGGRWVAATGDLEGTFDQPWLGVSGNGATVRFRFGEFNRLVDDQVVETRCLVDLPSLFAQVGRPVVPDYPGRTSTVPAPSTGDGVDPDGRSESDSATTLALVEEMIFGGLNKFDGDQASQGLNRFWSPDLIWYGPVGVGTAVGMDEFLTNAQGPIVGAIPDRKGVGHQARIAEGCYAASTGWPSLMGTHLHRFLDWPPTGEQTGWNIMDFWRRDGEHLVENWVLIDLIDAAAQAGVDLLARARGVDESSGIEQRN